jgi:hypothetical protein
MPNEELNMLAGRKISLTAAGLVSLLVAILSAAVTWGRTSNQIDTLQTDQARQDVIILAHEKEIVSMEVLLKEQYANIIWRLDRLDKKIDGSEPRGH